MMNKLKRRGRPKQLDNIKLTPVEGPTIPAIGESTEADADSVEAPDVDALKELESRLMNAIRDGLKEINKKVESLGNQLTLLEKEVRSLTMSVPNATGVLDIAKQMQSEHGEGNDEEDGSSKDDDMEEDSSSKDDDKADMSAMAEKFEMSEKAKNDVAKVGEKENEKENEKEKESGDVQTETKTKKRGRKADGKEGGGVAKKAKRNKR
ncbi:hypothetical protein IGI04_002781 [Brassica rapa subsp. trilocularis]|uniref:Uncharacterized protein n=1 Tax=Brassica rapa subsp. trilocularis TaxID=1813537 RepID=A0ABQ7NZV4_BRACM|nr:hypothetical protein IGI04_002781 [Brassica rapa subsp. trilocularis]